MSKKIELVHAEVVTQYQSEDVLREFTTDKGGTIFSWNVKTKVNDKAEKSPVMFDTSSLFVDTDVQKEYIRANITAGAVVNIKGYHDRRKGSKLGPDGKYPYYDQINVKEILPITGVESAPAEAPSDDVLQF